MKMGAKIGKARAKRMRGLAGVFTAKFLAIIHAFTSREEIKSTSQDS